MKIKRVMALLLLSALVATGCGKVVDIRDNGENDVEETVEESEEVTDTAETVEENVSEEGDAEDTETEENGVFANMAHSGDPIAVSVNVLDRSSTYYESTDYSYRDVARCEVQSIVLSEESAKIYPELAKTLEKKADDELQAVIDGNRAYVDSYKEDEDFKQYLDVNDMTLEDTGHRIVTRADDKVLSMCDSWYSFTGGVHGFYGKSGNTYDVQTGKELKFSDVVTDPQTFFSIANEKVQEQYGGDEQPQDITEYLKDYNDDTVLSWWVDYHGVTLYFGPYELGSYAMGDVEVKILFYEAPHIFDEKYMNVPDSYVMPISEMTELFLDMNDDGVIDMISYEDIQDPENDWGYYATDIYVNGECLSIDDWHYSNEAYVVCKDGQYFYVSFRSSEGDYVYCKVADLTNMKEIDVTVEGSGMAFYGWKSDYSDDGFDFNESETAVFTNPDFIRVNKGSDFLGTMSGNLDCHMDMHGNIIADSPDVVFRAYYCIKAEKAVPCMQVDADGNTIGDANLKVGAYYAIIRGDSKTYADLVEIPESEVNDEVYFYSLTEEKISIEPSDVLYRLEGKYIDDIDGFGYDLYIGGEPASELFSGFFYAG